MNSYPLAQITFSPAVEEYLDRLGCDIVLGALEMWQLPTPLQQLYVFAYDAGRTSQQAMIDHLEGTVNRLYREMCRRPPVHHIDPNRPSFAQIERIRGNDEHADEIEARNCVRFAEVPR